MDTSPRPHNSRVRYRILKLLVYLNAYNTKEEILCDKILFLKYMTKGQFHLYAKS